MDVTVWWVWLRSVKEGRKERKGWEVWKDEWMEGGLTIRMDGWIDRMMNDRVGVGGRR